VLDRSAAAIERGIVERDPDTDLSPFFRENFDELDMRFS